MAKRPKDTIDKLQTPELDPDALGVIFLKEEGQEFLVPSSPGDLYVTCTIDKNGGFTAEDRDRSTSIASEIQEPSTRLDPSVVKK